jgi:hypothetical protein
MMFFAAKTDHILGVCGDATRSTPTLIRCSMKGKTRPSLSCYETSFSRGPCVKSEKKIGLDGIGIV